MRRNTVTHKELAEYTILKLLQETEKQCIFRLYKGTNLKIQSLKWNVSYKKWLIFFIILAFNTSSANDNARLNKECCYSPSLHCPKKTQTT